MNMLNENLLNCEVSKEFGANDAQMQLVQVLIGLMVVILIGVAAVVPAVITLFLFFILKNVITRK